MSAADGPGATRVVLFTGKGGVGKTTTAAAAALHLADAGRRVALTSADPAHSLADALGVPLGTELREVVPGLWAQQVDARQRLEEHWGEVREWLLEVFDWAGVRSVEAEELSVLPGLDDLVALLELQQLGASGEYDVVVVDCGPTAETVRLLSLPELLGWYSDRLLGVSRRLHRLARPVLGRLTSLPIARDEVFAAGSDLLERIDAVRSGLADPVATSVRLVVQPEQMVLAEARRTWASLSLFGYSVDGVVVNRVLPDDADAPFLAGWRRTQARHLERIRADFDPLPVFRADLTADELGGIDDLRALAARTWAGVDPSARLVEGRPLGVEDAPDGPVLVVGLPHADADELDVTLVGGDLVVTLGALRRSLPLPPSLRRREVRSARFEAGELRVHFAEPAT